MINSSPTTVKNSDANNINNNSSLALKPSADLFYSISLILN